VPWRPGLWHEIGDYPDRGSNRSDESQEKPHRQHELPMNRSHVFPHSTMVAIGILRLLAHDIILS
jgi:hypothetical protein